MADDRAQLTNEIGLASQGRSMEATAQDQWLTMEVPRVGLAGAVIGIAAAVLLG